MRRTFALLVAALLLLVLAAPAGAAGRSGTWHRYNPGDPGSHERLVCTDTGSVFRCRYDTVPEIALGMNGSNDTGQFLGSATAADQDGAWCPEWAGAVCSHVEQYAVGATVYTGESGRTIWEELLFTDGDGVAPMYMFLVGPPFSAICPWYPTWAEVLENDPQCFFPG